MADSVREYRAMRFPNGVVVGPDRNLAAFADEYLQQLIKRIDEAPEDFMHGRDTKVTELHAKMMDAIERNSFNKDSVAIKRTCKALGIGYTYRDIRAYISRS